MESEVILFNPEIIISLIPLCKIKPMQTIIHSIEQKLLSLGYDTLPDFSNGYLYIKQARFLDFTEIPITFLGYTTNELTNIINFAKQRGYKLQRDI